MDAEIYNALSTFPAFDLGWSADDAFTHYQDKRAMLLSLKQYGGQSSAYFNLQEGVEVFQQKDAFLTYAPIRTVLGLVNIIFTDPVCSPEQMTSFVKAFVEEVPGTPMFCGVTESVAQAVRRLGWNTTMMGQEWSLDLNAFSVSGKSKKQLRHASNLNKRLPVYIAECSTQGHPPAGVEALSNKWRQTKQVQARELRLLTRPPVYRAEWGVRKFYCYHEDGRLLGFVFFDPYFEKGQIKGYCANILRSDPDFSHHPILDYVLLNAIQQFKEEGVMECSLGIAPMSNIKPVEGYLPAMHYIGRALFNYGNKLYAFKHLAYHKSRYRGTETPWFLCSPSKNPLKLSWALFKGTGVLG